MESRDPYRLPLTRSYGSFDSGIALAFANAMPTLRMTFRWLVASCQLPASARCGIGPVARDSLPFLYRHCLTGIHVRELVDLSAGPLNLDCIRLGLRAQTKRQNQFALRQITGAGAEHLPLLVVAGD